MANEIKDTNLEDELGGAGSSYKQDENSVEQTNTAEKVEKANIETKQVVDQAKKEEINKVEEKTSEALTSEDGNVSNLDKAGFNKPDDYTTSSGANVEWNPDASMPARNPKEHKRAKSQLGKVAHAGVSLAKFATLSILLGGPVLAIVAMLAIKYNKELNAVHDAVDLTGWYKPIFIGKNAEPGPFQDAHNFIDKHMGPKPDGGKSA